MGLWFHRQVQPQVIAARVKFRVVLLVVIQLGVNPFIEWRLMWRVGTRVKVFYRSGPVLVVRSRPIKFTVFIGLDVTLNRNPNRIVFWYNRGANRGLGVRRPFRFRSGQLRCRRLVGPVTTSVKFFLVRCFRRRGVPRSSRRVPGRPVQWTISLTPLLPVALPLLTRSFRFTFLLSG